MRLEVVPVVEEIRFDQISNRVVVIIDVLRASSTIVTALASGLAEVIPVETIGQAHALRSANTVLAGERHCRKIADFDHNNSPTELAAGNYAGQRLILTTTNGTRAIQKAERAPVILIGCFLNASACIRQALTHHLDITLYCAGTRSEFALEDGLAAGLMVDLAKREMPQLQTSDLGEVLQAAFLYTANRLSAQMRQTTTGKRLLQHGFTEDIHYCSQVDLFDLVPIVKEKRILPSLVS